MRDQAPQAVQPDVAKPPSLEMTDQVDKRISVKARSLPKRMLQNGLQSFAWLAAGLDVSGRYFRYLQDGTNNPPTSGFGVEITAVSNQGFVQAFDRSGGAFKPLNINAQYVRLAATGESIRVGTGTAGAGLDGSDGAIMADGSQAMLLFAGRNNNGSYALLYHDGTNAFLYTSAAAGVWQIAPATGLITQAGLGSITAGTSVSLNPAGILASGTRQLVPDALITGYISFTTTGVIGAGATIGTIATAGHRPTGAAMGVLRNATAGGITAIAITTAGLIVTDAGLANGQTFHGQFWY